VNGDAPLPLPGPYDGRGVPAVGPGREAVENHRGGETGDAGMLGAVAEGDGPSHALRKALLLEGDGEV